MRLPTALDHLIIASAHGRLRVTTCERLSWRVGEAMMRSDGQPRLEALFSLDGFLADANGDGYPDDLRTCIILPDQVDAELWCALLDLACRLGLETSGLTFPLVRDEPAADLLPIVVRAGQASEQVVRADGWRGRPAVVVEGSAAVRRLARYGEAEVESMPVPGDEPNRLDIAHLFEPGGLLRDADRDQIPDGTRLSIVVPPDLPRDVGIALLGFAARIGLESGGINLPLATTGDVPADAIPLQIRLEEGSPAALRLAPGPALELIGDPEPAARLLDLLAREWPAVARMPEAREALAWLRRSLAGWTPEGRAALLQAELKSLAETSPSGRLRLLVDDEIERAQLQERARRVLGDDAAVIEPEQALVLLDQEWSARWEVDRALDRLRERIIPALDPAVPVDLTVLVSEPAAVRREFERTVSRLLTEGGFPVDRCRVQVLDVYKAGLSWLRDVVLPTWAAMPNVARVVISYRPYQPASSNAFDLRIRWLEELFPADEIIASVLSLPLDRISLQEWDGDATYAAEALDAAGRLLAHDEFSPFSYERPYVGPIPDAGMVTVTTGGIIARQAGRTIREQLPTDLDLFWTYVQGEILPRIQQAILESTDGNPRAIDQPFFSELKIDVTVSEVDEPFGIREEWNSAAEALHEDLYFNVLDFIEFFGKRLNGERLSAPGAVVPVVHVWAGRPPQARITLRARARSVAQFESGGSSRPLGQIGSRPIGEPAISGLALDGDRLRITVDLGDLSEPERALLAELAEIRPVTPGTPALDLRLADGMMVSIAAPSPDELPAVEPSSMPTPDDKIITADNLFPLLARLATRPGVRVSLAERSYQGRPIPAVEIIAPTRATVWSPRKLSIFKPTFLYLCRHHANEVSSTTAALKLAERLVEDPRLESVRKRVNVAILPFVNADGAALHAELQREHPYWKHHPARYNAVGFEYYEDFGNPDSLYGEARVLDKLWDRWLPDVVSDNHGVPSHEWVQVFSGFGGAFRFRNLWLVHSLIYGIHSYLDDERYPEQRLAAPVLRDAITEAIIADPDLLAWDRLFYERYDTWARSRMPERFNLDRHNEIVYTVRPAGDHPTYARLFAERNPKTMVAFVIPETADETAHGEHLERTARAHLTVNRALLELLARAATPPVRRITETPDGVSIRIRRQRPMRLAR